MKIAAIPLAKGVRGIFKKKIFANAMVKSLANFKSSPNLKIDRCK
jgi:hypothetical protein